MKNKLYPAIETIISGFNSATIASERKKTLQIFIDFIQTKKDADQAILLNFICTHNSRRSHLSQVWAQALGYYFGIENLTCYSGGTETTAVYPIVIETLKNTGFRIASNTVKENPTYNIKYAEDQPGVVAFSKTFDDDFNPTSNFAAVMTCSHADENCPFIPGAEQRIPLTFDDPKAFDNTPQQAEKYNERSIQIATELFYIFSKIKPCS